MGDEADNIDELPRIDDSNQQTQNSELTQEQNDNVMSLPSNQGGDLKVIESKTICYCSNFDLNINDWFNEYENIEIFKINMKKNLGKVAKFWWKRRVDVAQVFSGGCGVEGGNSNAGGSVVHSNFQFLHNQLLFSRPTKRIENDNAFRTV